jgi:hypothetical protein
MNFIVIEQKEKFDEIKKQSRIIWAPFFKFFKIPKQLQAKFRYFTMKRVNSDPKLVEYHNKLRDLQKEFEDLEAQKNNIISEILIQYTKEPGVFENEVKEFMKTQTIKKLLGKK